MSGLILEGGGMRGSYTAGVLDFFLDKNIEFDSVYGVSAGSINACNFISKQKGRTLSINTDYLKDKRYASLHSLITTGDYFGVEMCYDLIPNELNPFDYETFDSYEGNFYAVITNCITGKAEYKLIKDMREDIKYIRASSSLPMMARDVIIDGIPYLDGGISDSIPIYQSRKDGNKKNVIILTRDASYRKKPNELLSIIKVKYKKYPELVKSIARRHLVYNKTLEYIKRLEEAGKVFVIRPEKTVEISRLEKDREKLIELHREGYLEAKKKYNELQNFLTNK